MPQPTSDTTPGTMMQFSGTSSIRTQHRLVSLGPANRSPNATNALRFVHGDGVQEMGFWNWALEVLDDRSE